MRSCVCEPLVVFNRPSRELFFLWAFGGMDMADFFSFEREAPKTLLSSCCFPPQTKRKGGSLSHTHKTHKTYKTHKT